MTALAALALSTRAAAADRPAEAVAWSEASAFATGPLAGNPVAKSFKAPSGAARWPEAIPLIGPDGPQSFAHWRGKTLFVTLWAEWCAPCLAEMPALARLNKAHRNRGFEILPIVTGSHTLRTYADARERLARLKGAEIDTLLDGSPDRRALMTTLAQIELPASFVLPPGAKLGGPPTGLPCLLIVDPGGRLRGRFVGGPGPKEGNLWETPAGEAFMRGLAEGAVA